MTVCVLRHRRDNDVQRREGATDPAVCRECSDLSIKKKVWWERWVLCAKLQKHDLIQGSGESRWDC